LSRFFHTLAILLGFILFSKAQNCETINNSKTGYYEKQYQKFSKKVTQRKKIGFNKAFILFDIATYLRQKRDTAYKAWYAVALELFRESYLKSSPCNKDADSRAGVDKLYKTGLCYFYLEDYSGAANFFSKAISAKSSDLCVYYYLSLAHNKQGYTDNAEKEMRDFKKKAE
jgi:tetratricopeptide (TPR) repeat protein